MAFHYKQNSRDFFVTFLQTDKPIDLPFFMMIISLRNFSDNSRQITYSNALWKIAISCIVLFVFSHSNYSTVFAHIFF